MGPFGGFGFLELLFIVLVVAFWGGILALIYLGIRWLIRQNDPRDTAPREDTALELLRQRFARGEIDAAEYEDRRRTLGG